MTPGVHPVNKRTMRRWNEWESGSRDGERTVFVRAVTVASRRTRHGQATVKLWAIDVDYVDREGEQMVNQRINTLPFERTLSD